MPAALESLGDAARRRPIEVDVPETLPAGRHRPGAGRAGARQPGRQRRRRGRPTGSPVRDRGRRGRRRPAHPGRRPRPGRPAGRPRADLPALPAAGRQSNGAGVGLGLAVARGFVEAVGGELTRRGHAGRRHHDGHHAPAADPRADRGGAGVTRSTGRGAGRRRRAADPPGAGHQPARPAATRSTSPPPARRRSTSRRATTPTSSCSTSACPASTGSR